MRWRRHPDDGMAAMQRRVAAHHNKQFGDKPLTNRALKVAEEAGEVAGAVIRHVERRDGRDWTPELRSEIGDLLITVIALCDKAGTSLGEVLDASIEHFLGREWDVQKIDEDGQ